MKDLMAGLSRVGELGLWKQVPELVKVRYKEAANVQRGIAKVLKYLPPLQPGYGQVFWNPESKTVWIVAGDSDTEQDIQRWHNAMKALPGVMNVKAEAEHGPFGDADWIRIKKAAALSWFNKPYAWAGQLTGGPSPFSNGLVSGLLGVGLGYGAGTLFESVVPEEYVERGKLRSNLAMLGGLGGAGLHVPQAVANASINHKATGQSNWGRSIFMGDKHQQMSPNEFDWLNHFRGGQKQKRASVVSDNMFESLQSLPLPNKLFLAATIGLVKEAMAYDSGIYGSNGVPLRPVPVDAFNNAIWNDVHNGMNSSQGNIYGTRSPYSDNSDTFHTPPVNAAAVTGLVSGIQQMYGNPSLLSPRHFISGLANAGVDLATAHVAGGVLGALGGLTPSAQKQLQRMGLWSGMIRGVTGSVLGLR